MKLNAYTIYDVAAGTYMRPWFAGSDGEALRGFKDVCADANHPVGQHPEDYTLYRCGTFNDTTGTLNGEELEKMKTGLECVHEAQMVNRDNLELFDKEISNGTN
jgi:hypothetical protein